MSDKKKVPAGTVIFGLLAAGFLFLPTKNLTQSIRLAYTGVMEQAVVKEFLPQVQKGSGNKEALNQFYRLSYGGTEHTALLTTTYGSNFSAPELHQRFQAGDTVEVLYLSHKPSVMIARPNGRSVFSIYHHNENLRQLYFLKFMGFAMTVMAVAAWFLGRKRAELLRRAASGGPSGAGDTGEPQKA